MPLKNPVNKINKVVNEEIWPKLAKGNIHD